MTMRNVVLIIVLVVLTSLLMGCAESEKALTVPAVVATQTKKVEEGPECKSWALVSFDNAIRLQHYRICHTHNDKEEEKRVEALKKAENICFEQCDVDFPDVGGRKCQENLDCVATCKGN